MKYYSKRELYALGETLGDSVTEHKVGGRIYGGGGKGGGGGSAPAPSSQTVTNTSIPEYARPYVETMLGQTQALTDINQNPYQTYGGERIAGFSPLQQQAFANVANQTTASQLSPATGLASASGFGSLGVAGQMAGAGQQYARQATNPYAQQAYMSPYIQNALQPQLQEMQRQYDITGLQEKRAATGQGAFGGNRQALMQSENERNKNMAMNQAIGTGYQNAFQAAQQAQQFGANLGLQGYQGALSGLGQANQAAGTLGQLGQTQFGQMQAINQAQQTAGAVQQAQAQQGLDTSYQDFLKQQNYPYQQLAFMSDMVRGLPLSQSAQSQYTAPPNAASQLGGLGMSALGIYGMSGGFKANGGMVGKGYAEGGQIGYATGGDVAMLTTDQLEKLLESKTLNPLERAEVEKQLMLRRRMEMNPESGQIMAPALRSGIASIGTGEMIPEQMAGGGIITFADGGSSLKRKQNEIDYTDMIKKRLAEMEIGNPFAKSEQQAVDIQKAMEGQTRQSPYAALAAAGLGTMAGTSQYGLTNLGLGGIEGLKSYAKSQGDIEANRKLLLQQQVEAEKAKYARDTGNLNALIQAQGQKDTKEIGLLNAKNTAGLNATAKSNALMIQAQNSYNQALDNAKDTLLKQTKFSSMYRNDPAAFNREAKKQALSQMSPQILEILGMKPTVDDPAAPPAPAANAPKSFPVPPPQAISALKSSKDQKVAKQQFDAIFGPGAADKAQSK